MASNITTNIKAIDSSADGSNIVVEFTSANGRWNLEIPLTEFPKIMVSMFSAAREAHQKAGRGDAFTVLPVHKIATQQLKKGGKGLLEIFVDAKSPGLQFAIGRQRLISFARGILEVTGHITPDPSRKLQ